MNVHARTNNLLENEYFWKATWKRLDFGVVRKNENHWTKILITVCMSDRKEYLDMDDANQNSVMERKY